MLERIQYAAIGALFGAVVGVLFWWLHGLGWNPRLDRVAIQPDLLAWVKPASLICAGVSFIFKDRVGSVAGGIINALYRAERDEYDLVVPRWMVVLVLLVAAGAGIYFATRTLPGPAN